MKVSIIDCEKEYEQALSNWGERLREESVRLALPFTELGVSQRRIELVKVQNVFFTWKTGQRIGLWRPYEDVWEIGEVCPRDYGGIRQLPGKDVWQCGGCGLELSTREPMSFYVNPQGVFGQEERIKVQQATAERLSDWGFNIFDAVMLGYDFSLLVQKILTTGDNFTVSDR